MFEDTASALFGVDGLQVTDVEAGPGGGIEVWAVTDWQAARACPDCGTALTGCMRRCRPGRGTCAGPVTW